MTRNQCDKKCINDGANFFVGFKMCVLVLMILFGQYKMKMLILFLGEFNNADVKE